MTYICLRRDECSICLNRMYRVVIGTRFVSIGKVSRLSCGHYFHTRCIERVLRTRIKCPICQSDVFTKPEMKLLRKNSFTVADIAGISPSRVNNILMEALRIGNDDLAELIADKFDPSQVIFHCISQCDVRSLLLLVRSRCINWHQTCHGNTLEDAAHASGDPIVKHIINNSSKFS